RVAFREPALEDEVPPFAVSALPQPIQERIPPAGGWRIRRQEADPVDLARRLRRGGKRHREQTQGGCDDEPDGAVPHGRLLASVSCRPTSCLMNEAERPASPAAGSRSDVGAKAGSGQVQALYRYPVLLSVILFTPGR